MSVKASRTQSDRSAATRAALVGAARRLFASSGFAGVGTEVIVRAAGVTRGALYHQFSDKVDLFAAVYEQIEAELVASLARDIAAGPASDPIEAMRRGADAWLEACADPEIQQIVLLDGPAVLGWERWREIALRHCLGLVEGAVSAAIEAGRLPRQPVGPLAHVLVGALDEAAIYAARAGDPQAARAEMRAVLHDLINGLATD
jgi:AcrR family transcriptional regulator